MGCKEIETRKLLSYELLSYYHEFELLILALFYWAFTALTVCEGKYHLKIINKLHGFILLIYVLIKLEKTCRISDVIINKYND